MEIASLKLRRLFELWESRCRAQFPRRNDFHPSDLRFILGSLSLIEVHRDPLRFLYRVHGGDVAGWTGSDLTGKFLEQSPNKGWVRHTFRQLADVVSDGRPSVAWYFDERAGDQYWNLEALVLPISSDGGNLDMLISAVERHSRGIVRAPLPRPAPKPRRIHFAP